MTPTITAQLEMLAKMRRETPDQVIAAAVQIGISKLFLDSVLRSYLKKKLSRQKALQLLGPEVLKTALDQQEAVRQDLSWGLGYDNNRR